MTESIHKPLLRALPVPDTLEVEEWGLLCFVLSLKEPISYYNRYVSKQMLIP